MQSFQFAPGDTSQSIDIFLPDSSSTTGAGLSGLVFNSSGLKAYYRNTATGTVTAITLATQTVGGAYSSGGFVELDATNAKGMYRLDLPNAALTSAGNGFVHLYGGTNLAQTPIQIVVGYPKIDVRQLLGTAWLTPAVAGTPDVNAKQVGGVAQTGGDIINAISNIAITEGGDAPGVTASSATYTTGTDSGGVANTKAIDGSYDSVVDAAGSLDFYYEFTVSTGQVAAAAEWVGYIVGIVNTVKFYIYNWTNSAWDQQGTIIGIAGTANIPPVEITGFTTDHTGTGGNAGKVRVRFQATGLTACTVKTDRIILTPLYTPPANWSLLAIDSSGRMDIGKVVGNAQTADGNGLLKVDVEDWKGAVAAAMTGDAFARLGAPAGASIAADIAEVEAETDTLLAGVTVTTNNDKTGYSLSVTPPTADAISQALLKYDLSTLSGEASHSPLNALRKLRNHWAISGTTLSVYGEDSTTVKYTQTLTAQAGADPIVGISD